MRYYTSRRLSRERALEAWLAWLAAHCQALHEQGHFPKVPDQVIINEYRAGQGIAPHIDIPAFEEPVASLSRGSTCVMDFLHARSDKKISRLLQPRSLLLFPAAARHEWKHGIAARKTDRHNGNLYYRGRRLSLTFRKLIDTPGQPYSGDRI